VILLDTSGLFAALNPTQRRHVESAEALRGSRRPRYLSPLILAELDYLVGRRVGERGRIELLSEVEVGAYELPPFEAADVAAARQIIEQYADLKISLADASIVVLSERYGTHDLLTLDERHFRVLRGAHGLPFRVLPADA
jgi:predicted nucleic acid-binding protein